MSETSRRDRMLAEIRKKLSEWDRGRAAELLQANISSEILTKELNRPAEERGPFLNPKKLPAFGRILDAVDDTDEAMSRAAKLVELLRRISNDLPRILSSDAKEAIATSEMPDTEALRKMEELKAARQHLKPSDAARLDARIQDLHGPTTRELWAHVYHVDLIGKRGGRRPKDAAQDKKIDRWRALLVREISALAPDPMVKRDEVIAELLTAAGIQADSNYVGATLNRRKR